MRAVHLPRCAFHDTPRKPQDLLLRLARLRFCAFTRRSTERRLQSLLSDLTPFMWSISSGSVPYACNHASL
jgi:hypothetical protein